MVRIIWTIVLGYPCGLAWEELVFGCIKLRQAIELICLSCKEKSCRKYEQCWALITLAKVTLKLLKKEEAPPNFLVPGERCWGVLNSSTSLCFIFHSRHPLLPSLWAASSTAIADCPDALSGRTTSTSSLWSGALFTLQLHEWTYDPNNNAINI